MTEFARLYKDGKIKQADNEVDHKALLARGFVDVEALTKRLKKEHAEASAEHARHRDGDKTPRRAARHIVLATKTQLKAIRLAEDEHARRARKHRKA